MSVPANLSQGIQKKNFFLIQELHRKYGEESVTAQASADNEHILLCTYTCISQYLYKTFLKAECGNVRVRVKKKT